MQEELEKDIKEKGKLYEEIIAKRKKINILVDLINEANSNYSILVDKFNKLDRKIFERTVGITKTEKKTKIPTKKIPKTLEELTSDERETLLAQLLDIQARRNRR